MTNPNFPDDEDEAPLDPAIERVRQRMLRLQLVSAGIMVIGLMAVIGAIVYKASRTDGAPAAATTASGLVIPANGKLDLTAKLPAGFVLESASLSGDRILLTGRDQSGAAKLAIFDMVEGRVIALVSLDQE